MSKKTQLKADTNVHTIRLHFNDTPEDQALYAALCTSSLREHRRSLPRHTKYLLAMAMGQKNPDLFLLKRLGFSDFDDYDLVAEAAATVARKLASPTCPAATLRLVPGGAESVELT